MISSRFCPYSRNTHCTGLGLHVNSSLSSTSVLRLNVFLSENFFFQFVNFAQTKIDDLEWGIWLTSGKQEIFWLQISMANTMFVAVKQGLHNLGEKVLGSVLGEMTFVDNSIEQFTSRTDFEDQIHVSLILIGLVQLDDIWMILLNC